MDRHTSMVAAVLLLVCFAMRSWHVRASDPELTTDFQVPAGVDPSTITGSFFTNTTLRNVSITSKNFATVTGINQEVFPALVGLGTSAALLQYPAGAINPPHTHPRGTELLYVLEGILYVGLIDTNNKLYEQTLSVGDLFVFPKGLVHYQINNGTETAKAIAAFSSSSPGLVRLPNTLFKSGIPENVLAAGFGVSNMDIGDLESATVN